MDGLIHSLVPVYDSEWQAHRRRSKAALAREKGRESFVRAKAFEFAQLHRADLDLPSYSVERSSAYEQLYHDFVVVTGGWTKFAKTHSHSMALAHRQAFDATLKYLSSVLGGPAKVWRPAQGLSILVHPGSLCGSADFNLSLDEGDEVRVRTSQWLAEEVMGHLLVLDNELSDEIGQYPMLDAMLSKALQACEAEGHCALRLPAEDPDHDQIGVAVLQAWEIPLSTPITLAGAWYDPSDDHGCVNALHKALLKAGFLNVELADCVASEANDEPLLGEHPAA